ncbi:MAG TPA: FIST N-terminal domain-containing protein, partial [Acidimicrobiales bacterium]|nr:FIST N-terminal domain-containing protein [Acidimicrobiales bacterium]
MPFAAGLSSHPVTALAAGEVIGSVLEQIGPHADVLVVGATPGHAGALEDVAAAVRAVLEPAVLIGAVARRLGDGAGARTEPALGLWGGSCGPAAAVRIEPGGGPAAPGRRGTAVLWAADAPGDDRLAGLGTVAGGVTAAPLLLEDRILRGGAVGLVTGRPDVRVVEVARPLRLLGPEAQVGAAEDRVVHELGGLPAMDGLLRMLRDVAPDDYRPADLRLSVAGTERAVT